MLDRMGAFALCVGTVEIRKNHARLLKLWELLAREAGAGWPKLVVAGKGGWNAREAVRALRRAGREAPYLWIEAPTDKELAWLYGRADFTVFPSLVEGWGAADRREPVVRKALRRIERRVDAGGRRRSLPLRRSARHRHFPRADPEARARRRVPCACGRGDQGEPLAHLGRSGERDRRGRLPFAAWRAWKAPAWAGRGARKPARSYAGVEGAPSKRSGRANDETAGHFPFPEIRDRAPVRAARFRSD